MRVTMNHQISGTRNGATWPAVGESIDLPDAEAASLVATGAATADAQPAPTEVADATPEGEQAVVTPAKPAKRTAKKRA